MQKSKAMSDHGDVINERDCSSFRLILQTKLQSKGYTVYYPRRQSGSMYYNTSILSGKAAELVYELMNRTPVKSSLNADYSLVKRQVALFPKSSDFDFRTLFDDITEDKLRRYFDDDLFHIINDITQSDSSLHRKSTSDIHTSDKTMEK